MADNKDTPNTGGSEDDVVILGTESSRATIVDPNDPSSTDTAITTGSAQDTPPATDSEEERLYAGRYKSVDYLEAGYKELQAEFTRTRQAAAQQPPAQSAARQARDEIDPEIQAQLDPYIRDLREELNTQKVEAAWGQLQSEFGSDVRKEVTAYYEQLAPADREALNTMAGARIIANLLKKEKELSKRQSGTQASGAPRSHHDKSGSTLTRAQIEALSPEEYARRQPEILRFYRENYAS